MVRIDKKSTQIGMMIVYLIKMTKTSLFLASTENWGTNREYGIREGLDFLVTLVL